MKSLLNRKPLSSSLLWLCGLLLVAAALPHWWNLHPLISASLVIFVALRLLLWPNPDKPAPGWLMLLLLPITLALVLYNANWTEGRQFGVALLVVMAGMKILEMKARRDLYVAVFLGYFVLITLFLFSQTPLLTVYVLLVSAGFTALLIAVNLVQDTLPWRMLIRQAGVLLLSGLPVMILLFVLFPRLEGPLWSLRLGGNAGVTGMSDHIRMGSISRLSQSSEVAFRVRFQGEPPPPAQRYWRGMVLWQTDGRNWERGDSALPAERFQGLAPPLDYEITMEASGQPWLFPLDHVLGAADALSLNTDGELFASSPINSRKTWRLTSSTAIRARPIDPRERQFGLQLPDNISARTKQLATRLRGKGRRDAEVVQAALRFFNQEAFIYTLQPPLLPDDPVDGFLFDTRRGFCEHYATSFVVLMRLANIPARVVIGYQGGEINPMGGHLIIRQSDAHAWAEVWLDGKGWVRADPTAAVAPERIQHSINNLPYTTGAPVTFDLGNSPAFITSMARRLKWFGDNLQLNWHYWVVGFNSSRQQMLLQKLGMSRLQGHQLGIAAAVGAIALGSLAFFLGLRTRNTGKDPVQQAYLRFRKKLEKSGLVLTPATGPQDLLQQAIQHFPQQATEMQAIMQQYLALRYGSNPRRDMVSALRTRVRKFRIS